MTQSVTEALNDIVAAVNDAQHKSHLRGTLDAELQRLGYNESEVTKALDEFFKVSTH